MITKVTDLRNGREYFGRTAASIVKRVYGERAYTMPVRSDSTGDWTASVFDPYRGIITVVAVHYVRQESHGHVTSR